VEQSCDRVRGCGSLGTGQDSLDEGLRTPGAKAPGLPGNSLYKATVF